jgi:phosphohistidine phosphatase
MNAVGNAYYMTLIRHAKSSWKAPVESDFDRPLNQRGRRDAPRMGAELARLGIQFDTVLCSSAVRARQTLAGLRQGMTIDDSCIVYRRELYLAPVHTLYDMVHELADTPRDIALIGHNPGIEDLAARLSGGIVDYMPTCCVVRIAFQNPAEGGRIEFVRLARELA